MKSSISCSTSAVVSARAPVSASSQGQTGCSPVSVRSDRRPECWICSDEPPPRDPHARFESLILALVLMGLPVIALTR